MKKTNLINIINIFLICCSAIYFVGLFYTIKTTTNVLKNNIYLESNKTRFLNMMKDAAIEDMKESGVFASVTLGQAVVESGWGTDSFALKYNNYFGMKTGSKVYVNGVATICDASHAGSIGNSNNSNQFWSGMSVCLKASEKTYSWFRVYDGINNSIKDHSRNFWCMTDGRYIKNGVFASTDPQTQLYTIAKSGYAVDGSGNITNINGLRYDEYIYQKIIIPNDFTSYDMGYKAIKPSYADSCSSAVYEGEAPTIPNSSQNPFDNFNTTYDGDITKGYVYQKQYGKALKISILTTADKIEERINNIISDIFNSSTYSNSSNNSFEIVNENSLNWKQYDANWGSIKLGSGSETIKSAGCLVTSVAIQIKASGTTINMDNFNPGTFVQYLNNNHGFSGSLFNWDGAWHGIAPNWNYYGKDSLSSSKTEKINQIKQMLNEGYYPVMCVKKNCGHWVAVTGVTDDNIIISDPGSNSNTVWPKYNAISNDSTLKVAKFKKND